MDIEQIRNNAPEGATHYFFNKGYVIYCKYIGSQLYTYEHSLGWFKTYGNITTKPL